MTRVRINLVTLSDVKNFVKAVTAVDEDVTLIDSVKHCVSGKSLMGAIYTLEWDEVYCLCDKDITQLILPWIVQ